MPQPQRHAGFTVGPSSFLLNGEPFRIFSGEMHYFRIAREYWRDRLLKLRAMGLNTVCTYMPWNLHEPRPGAFDFSGMLDAATFLREAQALGLWAILRPGPYICAEWDFGGLPAWLLAEPSMPIRCADARYLAAVARYIERVGRELSALTCTRGGPVLMVQVENEYGSYGNDARYLAALRDMLIAAGFDDVPLFTADGPEPDMLRAGTLNDCLAVANFGSRAAESIAALRAFRPNQPAMCGEFWCGWFDGWGKPRQGSSDHAPAAADLRWMLQNDVSFNLYMFHGGTNFGFTSGANVYDAAGGGGRDGAYVPQVTSYDYRAPLDEAGRPTAKYWTFRELLADHQPAAMELPAPPRPTKVITVPEIRFTESAALFDNLPKPIHSPAPRPMEHFAQSSGPILYRTSIAGLEARNLEVVDPHDYALVFLDGRHVATLDRRLGQFACRLPAPADREVGAGRLDVLIDTTGRVNYGPHLVDRKGITDRVVLGRITLMDWQVFPLPLDAAQRAAVRYGPADVAGPAFHRTTFELTEIGDTFLDFSAWRRGAAWINGHPLGRFWHVGPQQTLYCPGPWLRTGVNELVVFDLEAAGRQVVRGLIEPVLDACPVGVDAWPRP